MKFHTSLGLAAMVLGSVVGCGKSGPELAETRGKVLLDGKPLPEAVVEFVPQKGPPSYGLTDASGVYRLQFNTSRTGVLPGPSKVRISTARSLTDPSGKEIEITEKLPPKYNYESEEVREVKLGSNEINFELKSGPMKSTKKRRA
ncbi:MAG TPA: carboxypeptidase regulatory-like domain-containing protein [Pirellulales bacterium]